MQCSGHLVNRIVLFFQLTSGLCLTSQSWPRNISIPSRFVTTASNCSVYLSISISRGATLVTSPFFVPSALKTLNEKLIGFVGIFLSLTNCSSIPMCVHSESTNVLISSFFPFFVLIFACTFNSCFPLLFRQFEITYLFWEFTWEISCTVPTRDHCQNPPLSCCLHCLSLSWLFYSSLFASSCNPLQCVLLYCIWSIFSFFILFSFLSNSLPYARICCSWNTLVSHLWNCHWTS